jgi:two-component system cell cycle response regulator
MKKEILIYETDPKVLKYLKAFFKEHDDYSVHFIRKDRRKLKKEILVRNPDILIVSSPKGLRDIHASEVNCPIIAIISKDKTRGIRSVIESDIECYILSPFYKDDLNNKLLTAARERNWLDILSKEKADLMATIELMSVISSTLKPQNVLNLIVQKIAELIQVKRCSFISIGIGNQRYADVISTSDDLGAKNIRIDLKKYPEIRKALSLRKAIVIKDAKKDPLMKEVRDLIEPIDIRSIVVVPVVFREEIIGTLFLRTSKAGRTFTKREIKLCVSLASVSANALYNAFLYERVSKERKKLEMLAITDYLTGIYNIRYFYNRIEEEFSRSDRYSTELSCIMFDIDHFKLINDKYGHRVGDIILREFAQLVKRHTRKSDVFARYGGEEFISLLPQTSLKGALAEGERIKKAVTEHKFLVDGTKIGITISLGIASSPHERIKKYDDLINFADTALYKAKLKGRNRIAMYPS